MTKARTKSEAKSKPGKDPVKQYVILKRISYKAMIPAERELIDPAEDPYAPDAPRRPFEHLGKADINRLLMRKVIAEDK